MDEQPTRILVTGAGGYVGRHVVTGLLDRLGPDAAVTAVVRPGSRREIDARARIVEADVLDPALDLSALGDDAPQLLVHLAWQDGFTHNAPSHMERLSDHYRFLRSVAAWGVDRISALGTMHEVGYWEGAIDADTPCNPVSLYGIAKDALRRSVLASITEPEVQWLRCYYIYGDDRRNRSIFTRLLEAADEGKTTFPFTSGVNRYDFIEVSELGRQIAAVAVAPGVTGIVNCCTGIPVPLGEMVERFIADNGLGLTLDYGAFPDRPYDSPGVWGDATIVRDVLAASA